VGIVICDDRWNPLITRALVFDGARMMLIPSLGAKAKKQNQTVLARARENGAGRGGECRRQPDHQ
jgi:predicted amidohydrolase